MKGKFRYIAVVVGVLILILIALPFFISVNSFRPVIEQRLTSALGRKVQVGDLSFSILSSTLSAENLSISDDPSFSPSPFLTAKSIRIGVELWPLIASKALNVTSLTIEKPEVSLVRDKQRRWNFSTLATQKGSQAPPAGPGRPTPPSNRGDQPATTSSAGGAAPDFTVAKLKLEDGRVSIGSTGSDKKSVYDNVDLEASNLSLRSQFPVTLTANLPGGGELKVEGTAGPVNQADASLSPLDAKVTVSRLDLGKTGFVDPGSGVGGVVDVTNTLRSKDGLAHAEGSVKMERLQLVKGGAPSSVPVNVDFGVDYDLGKNSGVLRRGIVKVGSAVSRISGKFDQGDEATLLDLKLDGQNLPVKDLQAALPAFGVILPKGSSLETGTLNANLNIQGPADKPVTSGNVGLFNAKLAGFDIGSKMSTISAFSSIQKNTGDTSIQKLTTDIRVAPEGIQANNLDLVMPVIGQLNGGGTVSPSNALNFKMVATLSAQSGMASAVGGLTGRTLSKNATIPFMVQGTMSDPKFVPDVKGMLGGAAQSELGKALERNPQTKGLGGALEGILGGKKKKK